MLEVEGISKAFIDDRRQSRVVALEDVTLTFAEGEFVSLLGPSGCGKTTLLHIAAGLVKPDQGVVRVAGRVVRGPGIERAMVFQNYGLLPWRSVMGNVEFGLEVRGVGKKERRERAAREVDRVGLRGFERHYAHELSGGMQQRVALARCLAKDAKILLMDEPFAAVDMLTREFLQDELLRILSSIRPTVLFVTHSIDEAIYLGDRVIVMSPRPGRVTADIAIDLPRARHEGDTKALPRFGELRHVIRESLSVSSSEAIGVPA